MKNVIKGYICCSLNIDAMASLHLLVPTWIFFLSYSRIKQIANIVHMYQYVKSMFFSWYISFIVQTKYSVVETVSFLKHN